MSRVKSIYFSLIKKLSLKEMQSKQEKGLCFNCEEKLHKNHKCKSKFLALLSEIDDMSNDELPDLHFNNE